MTDAPRWTWHHTVCVVAGGILTAFVITWGTFKVREVRIPVIHRITTLDTVWTGKPYAVRGPRTILYRTAKPDTVLVTLPGTVDTLVTSFCETLAHDTTAADSARHRQLVLTAGTMRGTGVRCSSRPPRVRECFPRSEEFRVFP